VIAIRRIQIMTDAGIALSVAKEVVSRMEQEEDFNKKKKYDRDFERILAPLDQQIKSLCSSRTQWAKDPVRNEVYSAYLSLCRKVKIKIQGAARIAALKNQSVMEAALENGITEFDGRRWSAWVPYKVRIPFLLAFEKLPPGRKVTPFLTSIERSASEKRWDRITTHIEVLRHTNPADSEIHRFLNAATTAITSRTSTAVAPVQWSHLLSTADRKAYRAWSKRTLGGLRGDAV
jgi:hypothetical protein